MKVLILGIGYAQKDAIVILSELGHKVIACSYSESGSAREVCDEFFLVDIKDINQVKQLAQRAQVDLIYSMGSDLAMPTVSIVSEMLNLPHFLTYEDSLNMKDKGRLRHILSFDRSLSIEYSIIQNKSDIQWSHYPCIVKPTDSQGQRGVSYCRTLEELNTNFEKAISFSPSKRAIVEEYIDGQEYSANAYIANGQLVFCFITKRISHSEYPGGIIKEHVWEATTYVWEEQLKKTLMDISALFRVLNGPLYTQFKVNSDGKIKIVEITPRFDGCHLWRLIVEIFGIDLREICFKHLMGDAVPISVLRSAVPLNNKQLKLAFMGCQPNTAIDYSKWRAINSVYYEEYYKNGESTHSTNGYIEKAGYWIEELQ